jgi:hypothetical protein
MTDPGLANILAVARRDHQQPQHERQNIRSGCRALLYLRTFIVTRFTALS